MNQINQNVSDRNIIRNKDINRRMSLLSSYTPESDIQNPDKLTMNHEKLNPLVGNESGRTLDVSDTGKHPLRHKRSTNISLKNYPKNSDRATLVGKSIGKKKLKKIAPANPVKEKSQLEKLKFIQKNDKSGKFSSDEKLKMKEDSSKSTHVIFMKNDSNSGDSSFQEIARRNTAQADS